MSRRRRRHSRLWLDFLLQVLHFRVERIDLALQVPDRLSLSSGWCQQIPSDEKGENAS